MSLYLGSLRCGILAVTNGYKSELMLLHVFLVTIKFCLIILFINFESLLSSVVHDFS